MPPQLSALRKFPGIIRVATLLLGILGLIFIIVALSLHSSREYVGYEASFYAFISVTSYAWTILWSISAICVLLFHGPYHPAIDIGFDFVSWGLAWAFAVLILWWSNHLSYGGALKAMETIASVFALLFGACHLWMIVEAVRTLKAKGRTPKQSTIGASSHAGTMA